MSLSTAKVAILYQSIIDQTRPINEVIKNILLPIKINLYEDSNIYIHISFFRWAGMAKNEPKLPIYSTLKQAIIDIKKDLPNAIIGGALLPQEIWEEEYDPYLDKKISKTDVWNDYALDPSAYGFSMNKTNFQNMIFGNHPGYIFPDILSSKFQTLLIDFAKAQIDAGIDTIWLDGLTIQLSFFYKWTKSWTDPRVVKCINAIKTIVDKIHKYDSTILIGSWAREGLYLTGMNKNDYPKLNFVTHSPSSKEISSGTINTTKWDFYLSTISKIYGNIDIISMFDWAFSTSTPLGTFSQSLTTTQQKNFLINMESYMKSNNILFAYPVHGGYMGDKATKLSTINGKQYNKYDALASEFNTFSKILDLINGRIAELKIGDNHTLPSQIKTGISTNFKIEVINSFNKDQTGYFTVKFQYPSGAEKYTSTHSLDTPNITFNKLSTKQYNVSVTIPTSYTQTGKHDINCDLLTS